VILAKPNGMVEIEEAEAEDLVVVINEVERTEGKEVHVLLKILIINTNHQNYHTK